MIKLSDTTPFAHGNHRKVYRDPIYILIRRHY